MKAKVKFVIIGVEERKHFIEDMLKEVKNATVFFDDVRDKNCLKRFIKVLKLQNLKDYTHICVLQDDLELCYNFEEIVEVMCSNFPNALWSPYNSRLKYEDKKNESPYIEVVGCGCYGQCMIIPTKLIDKFIKWVNENLPEDFKHDDEAFGQFAYENGTKMMATIPSLIQHLQPCNSTLKYNNKNKISKVYEGKIKPNFYNWNTKEYSKSHTITNGMALSVRR